jgi:protein SCO1/2
MIGKLKRSDKIGLALTAIISLGAISSSAQIADLSPPELQKIDVVEHPGEQIPLDLTFQNGSGEIVTLGNYFHQGKPVILILAYYECPMLCTLVLNGISESIRKLSWLPGKEFQMITVSIDPREKPELAAGKKKIYLDNLSKPVEGDGWVFLVGEEDQSKALAEVLGFEFYYDEERKQYAHPAVVFILTEGGKISRYLYGIEFDSRNLRLALLEASEGKIGNTLDRILLYCYHYDPDAQGYVVFAANVMRLGGGVTLIALLIFLGVMWGRERRKRSAARSSMIEGE